jgi:hypothetical protein
MLSEADKRFSHATRVRMQHLRNQGILSGALTGLREGSQMPLSPEVVSPWLNGKRELPREKTQLMADWLTAKESAASRASLRQKK